MAGASTKGPIIVSSAETDDSNQECELFGIFGLFIQLILGAICIGALVGKFGVHFC